VRVFVIVATVGRADLLKETIAQLARQTRRPDGIVVCAPTQQDVGDVERISNLPIEIIFAEKGLPRQRNAALRHVTGRADIVVFFDDDFVPANDYLEALEKVFILRPNLVGATGKLIADGIKSSGISFEQGAALVDAHKPADIIQVRMSAAENIWFDESLPLYGWQEDVDFSFQLGRNGILIYTNLLTGVHLGIKGGRTSGKRLGYSQIANPVYLLNKKTIPPRLAWRLMSRNVAANLARSFYPEPYVDRFGRLKGNVALVDLFTGRLHPQRILQL
jgi:glycosyltransferase involved in cell wall biosynthesis